MRSRAARNRPWRSAGSSDSSGTGNQEMRSVAVGCIRELTLAAATQLTSPVMAKRDDEEPEEPDGGQDLLRDWQAVMKSLIGSAASAATRPVPEQLLAPMQRQVELVEEILERERRIQRDLFSRAF